MPTRPVMRSVRDAAHVVVSALMLALIRLIVRLEFMLEGRLDDMKFALLGAAWSALRIPLIIAINLAALGLLIYFLPQIVRWLAFPF